VFLRDPSPIQRFPHGIGQFVWRKWFVQKRMFFLPTPEFLHEFFRVPGREERPDPGSGLSDRSEEFGTADSGETEI
jgi:hypothetical protein